MLASCCEEELLVLYREGCGVGNWCSEPKEEVSLRRRWSYGCNTIEKGSAKIKESRTEQMKVWRKYSPGVLALKKP